MSVYPPYASYEWPPTPASSSATVLPSSRSVASFKSYESEEPERGRSLSRSSSGSSSGVLVLASPSSIDSSPQLESENLQYAYGYPMTSGVASSMQQSVVSTPKAPNSEAKNVPSATTSTPPQQDLLGLEFPPAPASYMDPYGPTAANMDLFGPRSPSPSGCYSISPTPRPLSRVTERTESPAISVPSSLRMRKTPSVASVVHSHGLSSQRSRSPPSRSRSPPSRSRSPRPRSPGSPARILPSVPILARTNTGSSRSSRDTRGTRRTGRTYSTSPSRSRSPLAKLAQGHIMTGPPVPVEIPTPLAPRSRSRGSTRSSRSSMPRGEVQVVVLEDSRTRSPSQRSYRSRSRSPRFQRPRTRSSSRSFRDTPQVVILPPRSRSRSTASYARSRSPEYSLGPPIGSIPVSPPIVQQPPVIIDTSRRPPYISSRRSSRSPSRRSHSPVIQQPVTIIVPSRHADAPHPSPPMVEYMNRERARAHHIGRSPSPIYIPHVPIPRPRSRSSSRSRRSRRSHSPVYVAPVVIQPAVNVDPPRHRPYSPIIIRSSPVRHSRSRSRSPTRVHPPTVVAPPGPPPVTIVHRPRSPIIIRCSSRSRSRSTRCRSPRRASGRRSRSPSITIIPGQSRSPSPRRSRRVPEAHRPIVCRAPSPLPPSRPCSPVIVVQRPTSHRRGTVVISPLRSRSRSVHSRRSHRRRSPAPIILPQVYPHGPQGYYPSERRPQVYYAANSISRSHSRSRTPPRRTYHIRHSRSRSPRSRSRTPPRRTRRSITPRSRRSRSPSPRPPIIIQPGTPHIRPMVPQNGSRTTTGLPPQVVVIQPSSSSTSSSASTKTSSSRTHTPDLTPHCLNIPPPPVPQNSWGGWAWEANNQAPPAPIPFIAPSASPMVPPSSWNFNNNDNNQSVPPVWGPQWNAPSVPHIPPVPHIPYVTPQEPHIPPVNSSWAWGAPPIPQHPRFFFEDGNVTITVENTLYKLHRYLFNKRTNWNFDISGYPTHLWASSKKDLDRFLTILYPADYSKHECETAEEWASVLTIADNLGMQDIRRLAISRLAEVAGPVDKIVLGHKYNIKEWLAPAYLALAMRTDSITPAEGAKLGVDALVRLAALQDEVYQNLRTYISPNKFAEMFESKLTI